MSTTQKKGKAARLYIGDEEEKTLKKLAEATDLSETMVMSQIIGAGLRACRDAGNRLPLPLRFTITDTALSDRPAAEPTISNRLRK